MKRLILWMLVWMMVSGAALADSFVLEDSGNLRYDVETFTADVPSALRECLSRTPFAADEVICGAVLGYYYRNLEDTPIRHALLAVQHGETRLLLAAEQKQGVWDLWPASATLLPRTEDFTITVVPVYGLLNAAKETISRAQLTVQVGDAQFRLSVGNMMMEMNSRSCELDQYYRLDSAGNGILMTHSGTGQYTVKEIRDGQYQQASTYDVCWPAAVSLLDGDAFPATEMEMAAWAAQHPFTEDATAYIFGANLRQKATGKSASLGQYHYAPLVIFGEEPGTQFPWYHVRIGDTEGWVSGNYVARPGDPGRSSNYLSAQSTPLRVLLTSRDAFLYADMSGKVKQELSAGAGALVLAEADGWYHVVLAEKGQWTASADSVYGYLKAADVQLFEDWLQAEYGFPAHRK